MSLLIPKTKTAAQQNANLYPVKSTSLCVELYFPLPQIDAVLEASLRKATLWKYYFLAAVCPFHLFILLKSDFHFQLLITLTRPFTITTTL